MLIAQQKRHLKKNEQENFMCFSSGAAQHKGKLKENNHSNMPLFENMLLKSFNG